jgi:hypothetical protein
MNSPIRAKPMRAGPFSWKWVREDLVFKERGAKGPHRGGCGRIAVELNRVFMLVNEPRDSPHLFRAQAPRWDDTAAPGHPRQIPRRQRLPPHWHDDVLAMAEVVRTEIERVNPYGVDVGYSKDGPIVRLLVDAIPIITGEQPTRDAVAKKLRQR